MTQEGIPIQEFEAQSPENAKIVADFRTGLDNGSIIMCGCMGPMYGEPFCPCKMVREGLQRSDQWAQAQQVSAESAKGLQAFFEKNRLAKE